MNETFVSSFASSWIEKSNEWSQKFAIETANGGTSSFRNSNWSHYPRASIKNAGRHAKDNYSSSSSSSSSEQQRSVDEQIDDTLELTGSAYERGARLGYTIGKFIDETAAGQWSDPDELNTFTYDSLFLAKIGHDHDAEHDSQRRLEQLIVTETTKRVAFVEANRKTFAKALHWAYLNGLFIVPKYGILHSQRAVAKRGLSEGAQTGFEAASRAASEFVGRAMKFLSLHERQRALATRRDKTAQKMRASGHDDDLRKRINDVRTESELNGHITSVAIDCGQKSGAIMGAQLGLIVVPEAFETFVRARGSLEALRSEFYQYKLGALRGYELAESWAMLNFTGQTVGRSQPIGHTNGGKPKLESIKGVNYQLERILQTAATKYATQKGPNTKTRPLASVNESPNFVHHQYRANVDNIFQFMAINYGGSHLVANHTRNNMLTLRSLIKLDDKLVTNMKIEFGDLIAKPQAPAQASHQSDAHNKLHDDILVGVPEQISGELKGELRLSNNERQQLTKPIKFDIIDLGPILELIHQHQEEANSLQPSELETIPLTVAMSKVDNIYIKLRLARDNNNKQPRADELERYLNADQFDPGDGFMCGALNQLRSAGGHQLTTSNGETRDDLDLEAFLLDELYERIEHAPANQSAVALSGSVMKV